MRSAYRVLSGLIALCVVLQASFIAGAWFGVLKDVDGGAVLDKNYGGNLGHNLHSIFGMGIVPLLGLVLLIVSFFAKVPSGVKWAGIVFGLIVLQVLLAFVAFGVPAIGALHGINAIAVLGTAITASRLATTAAPVGATAPVTEAKL